MQYGDTAPQEGLVPAIGPEDLNTAANDGTYISMADYDLVEMHILIGDIAGGAAVVTVEESTDLSATGEQAVTFTRYYQSGQKLKFDNRSAANFQVGETITGGGSSNQAYVVKVSSDHLLVCVTVGTTTWTDNEEISGGTSLATADVDGTGESEDIMLERTASNNTFSTLAITFKHYMIPISKDMLDVDDDYDCVHLKIAQAASSETQGCAWYVLKNPRYKGHPMPSAISTSKIV